MLFLKAAGAADADSESKSIFPPSFAAARSKQGQEPMRRRPLLNPDDFERLVPRKLGEKRTAFATLSLDPVKKTYKLNLGSGIVLHVDLHTLQTATQIAHGSEWVRLTIQTDHVRLKRTELRNAFHELERLK